jgi:hypothetical protein
VSRDQETKRERFVAFLQKKKHQHINKQQKKGKETPTSHNTQTVATTTSASTTMMMIRSSPSSSSPSSATTSWTRSVDHQSLRAPSRRPLSSKTSVSTNKKNHRRRLKLNSSSSNNDERSSRGDALGGQDFIYSQKSGVTEELFMNSVDADIATGEMRVNEFKELKSINADDFTVPERLLEKIGTFLTKNYLMHYQGKTFMKKRTIVSPLLLGIWGGKGCGKSFNVELACAKLGVLPIVTSAGELEDATAGEPGKLLRRRYLAAGKMTRETGVPTCLIINDIDAGVGRFKHTTSSTVNNQIVQGTLMNIADNPTNVYENTSIIGNFGNVPRVPIIVTGNDFSRLYAPLARDGRMDKFFWEPSREEIVGIMTPIFAQHGLEKRDTERLVSHFPNQPLDFFSAVRNRAIDAFVLEFCIENEMTFTSALLGSASNSTLQSKVSERPISYDTFVTAARYVQNEQQNVNNLQLSREYLANWVSEEDMKAPPAKPSPPPELLVVDDEKSKALFEAAKKKMLETKSGKSIKQFVQYIDMEDADEDDGMPWETININRAFQIMYENAMEGEKVVTIDARPVKDFNRETCKGAQSFPAAIRKGGLSDFVDEPDVEECVKKIKSKLPNEGTHIIVLLDDNGNEYETLFLEALSKEYSGGSVKRIEGGLPNYFKHFTPKGTRRPRYVGYGQDNEETMWTGSN